jgi:hypothetical protein
MVADLAPAAAISPAIAPARPPSVDVELVALRVLQRDRVVVHALLEFLAQVAEQRGAEITQPQGLGVHTLLAGLDREASPAAGVDVDVEPTAAMGLLKSGRGVAGRPGKYAEGLRQSGSSRADRS